MNHTYGWEAIGRSGHSVPKVLAQARQKADEAWKRYDDLIDRNLTFDDVSFEERDQALQDYHKAEQDASNVYHQINNDPNYGECACVDLPDGRAYTCDACKEILERRWRRDHGQDS